MGHAQMVDQRLGVEVVEGAEAGYQREPGQLGM
jgi:hypothetical protein